MKTKNTFLYAITLFLYSLTYSLGDNLEKHNLFEVIDELGSKEGVYLTFEADTSYHNLTRFVTNKKDLLTLSLSDALEKLFPEYNQMMSKEGNLKVIHLVAKDISRPYLMDDIIRLNYRGSYNDLVVNIDNKKGSIEMDDMSSFSINENVYVADFDKPVDSLKESATVRDQLSECFEFSPRWRILWISKIKNHLIIIRAPGNWSEVKASLKQR